MGGLNGWITTQGFAEKALVDDECLGGTGCVSSQVPLTGSFVLRGERQCNGRQYREENLGGR